MSSSNLYGKDPNQFSKWTKNDKDFIDTELARGRNWKTPNMKVTFWYQKTMNSPVPGFLRKDISSSRAKWFFAAGPNGLGDLHLLKKVSIMDKYLICGWQRKQIFHAYWNNMDVEDQIDKASDEKELDYGLPEDSSWGL